VDVKIKTATEFSVAGELVEKEELQSA